MGGGGRDLLHYSCHHLLPFRKSCSTGLWALEPGRGLRRWSNSSSSAWSHRTNMRFKPASAAALTVFWFQLYHHVKYKQPDRSTCAIGICWNGERMWGSKHKQQATSTAITGINKESTRATAERGHHIRSKSQHMKYKCCQNRQDFFSKDTFPKTKCALCFQSFRSVLNLVSKALLLAAWRRKLLTHYPICPWGD